MDISNEDLEELLKVDPEEWKKQIPLIREHLAKFGDRLPAGLKYEVDALEKRLEGS
jgi:phosphoenolpyruvate carboxykinase (GTP)